MDSAALNGATAKPPDRLRGEDALRRSEERYRALVEATSQAVWSWSPDGADGDFERTQQWWEGVTGQSPERQRASHTAWLEVVHPDDREAARVAWGTALASGTRYDIEYRVRGRGDGWRHVHARGVPVRNPDGSVREWVGTLDDVTDRRRAEAESRQSEARFRRLAAAGVIGVIRWDLDRGLILDANDEFLRMTGYDRADLAAGRLDFRAMTPPEWTARNEAGIRELRETGVGGAYEKEYVRKDGGRVPVIIVGVRFEDTPREGMSFVTDITARKRAEAALRESEERHRALATATADVVYRMTADWAVMQPLDGRGLVRSSAEPERDWMGKNLPASEHARVREAIDRAVSNKQTFELEHRVHRADGTPGWTLSRAVPILDAAGTVVEWFGTARDVTAHKQAEEAVARVTAESERRKRLYETILSATPDFVYVFSLDHRVLYANDALIGMWGRGQDGAIGKTFLEIGYEPWHAAMHDREIDRVRETRQPVRGEVPFHGTHGRRIYDYIFVPVIGADGEVEAVAGTTRDVTDRKAMEDDLREADRKKDDFIALLAHELRNPLAPIRNGLQVLRLADDPATRTRAQEVMGRQLAHMVRLIDDLLDVSRITRNKLELRRSRVALADVVSSAVETARPAVEEAGHELTVSLPSRPVFLDADLTRLSQVFGNLLTNSAKYTPRGGQIWLSAARTDGGVAVSVRDTGIGIPAESLPAIFDMFSQVDRSIERSTGGLGIGLALVRGLVDMHGGTVSAHSAGTGRGSTFTVTLPALAEVPDPAPAPPADGRLSPGPRRRILVVDDNRDGAESLAMMLALCGNEVAVAHDGLDAVERAERFRPEVVLMDVGMPRLNGLDATRRIRGQPWGKAMTVVALTGWGQDGDRERSRDAGCDGHLVKPVAVADLERLLAELVGPGPR